MSSSAPTSTSTPPLTIDTCIDLLLSTPRTTSTYESILTCIDLWLPVLIYRAHEHLSAPDKQVPTTLLSLPLTILYDILQRDTISCDELSIWLYVITHLRHMRHIQLQADGQSVPNMTSLVTNPFLSEEERPYISSHLYTSRLIYTIRLPTFNIHYLATHVMPMHVVAPDEMLALFTYATSHVASPELSAFNCIPRIGRIVPTTWIWSCTVCQVPNPHARTSCVGCDTTRQQHAISHPPTEDEQMVMDVMIPPTPTQPEAPPIWTCAVCTCENPIHAGECEACGSAPPQQQQQQHQQQAQIHQPQPQPQPQAQHTTSSRQPLLPMPDPQLSPDSDGYSTPPPPTEWACMSCTYVNQPHASICEMCDMPRDISDDDEDSVATVESSSDLEPAPPPAAQAPSSSAPSSSPALSFPRCTVSTSCLPIDTIFQCSLDKHIHAQDPLPIPIFAGLDWYAVPHLGIYGDPYRIAFPLALVHLPRTLPFLRAWLPPRVLYALTRVRGNMLDHDLERDAQLLVHVVGERIKQMASAPIQPQPQAPPKPQPVAVAGDPNHDAFMDDVRDDHKQAQPQAAPIPIPIPDFAPPAIDVAALHRIVFATESLECYVIVHDRLGESPVMASPSHAADGKHDEDDVALAVAMAESARDGAADAAGDESANVSESTPLFPFDLNIVSHPWLFRHLRCENGVATSQPLIMGIFGCTNVSYAGDVRLDPIEARVTEMMGIRNTQAPMLIERFGMREVNLHDVHFSPNNAQIRLKCAGVVPSHSFYLILHDPVSSRTCLSYHLLPGTVATRHRWKLQATTAQSAAEFLPHLGLNAVLEAAQCQ